MAIEHTKQGKWTIARLQGRMDGQTSPALETELRALLEQDVQFLALDLAKVNYVSSAGLRVVLSLLKLCKAKNGSLAVLSPVPMVQEVLEISGFTSLFPILAEAQELES